MPKSTKYIAILIVALLTACFVCGCSGISGKSQTDKTTRLQMVSYDGLKNVLGELEDAYSKTHKVKFLEDICISGTSTALQQLPITGAYIDGIFQYSNSGMDLSANAGVIRPDTRFNMAVARLDIVASKDKANQPINIQDIASGKYTIAIPNVGVTIYRVREALSAVNPPCWIVFPDENGAVNLSAGTFDGGPLEGKVNIAPSIDTVKDLLLNGSVDYAFMLSFDVAQLDGIEAVCEVPNEMITPMVYPVAVASSSTHSKATKDFFDWAHNSDEAIDIWKRYGFSIATQNDTVQVK